jgi:hypothetical protein
VKFFPYGLPPNYHFLGNKVIVVTTNKYINVTSGRGYDKKRKRKKENKKRA